MGKYHSKGLPQWFSSKRIDLQCRRPRFDSWVRKIPWRREWLPTPVFWLGNPMDRGAWGQGGGWLQSTG